jgi:polyisoprenoid-binding protein YceI
MQKKVTGGVVIVIVSIVVLLIAGAAYVWFSGGSGAASTPVTAPELQRQPGDPRLMFHIVPEESDVRIFINEVLLGEPKTVVGATNQVAGNLLVDFENPASAQVGLIRVNVRTLETDNEIRNRALRGQILEADEPEFEFAEFIPTGLRNLPDDVTINEPFTFEITGMLRVHGVARNITFEATVTPVSETRIEGFARTTVDYRDFDMRIPSAAGVGSISNEVGLEIDFVAVAEDGAA